MSFKLFNVVNEVILSPLTKIHFFLMCLITLSLSRREGFRTRTFHYSPHNSLLYQCYCPHVWKELLDLPGILRDKTMADQLVYIPNDKHKIAPSVDYN